MTNALEKAHQAAAQIIDADDEQLRELAGPIPLPMVRGVMYFLPQLLPNTPEELDARIDQAQAFIDWLRSDDDVKLIGT